MTAERPAADLPAERQQAPFLIGQFALKDSEEPSIWRALVSPALSLVSATEWDRLLELDDAPLQSWAYLQGLEAAGCVGGNTSWQPAHLLIRRLPAADAESSDPSGGELVAAAPAYIKVDSDGEWVNDFDWAEFSAERGRAYYPKLALAVPFNPVGGGRLLTRPELSDGERDHLRLLLLQTAKKLCQLLHMSSAHILFPRYSEAAFSAMAGAGFLLRQQEQYHFQNFGRRYHSFEDFLLHLRGHRRTAIRRERRALHEAKITVRTYRGLSLQEAPERGFTLEQLDKMFDLYVGTSLRYTGGPPYLNRRFFHLMAERLGDRLELVLASNADGKIIGGAWNLRGDRRLFGRYWGQDQAAPAKADPEEKNPASRIPFLHFEVCYYHSVERCIIEGLEAFEPGHGGEQKLIRGFTPVLTYSAHYLREAWLRKPIASFLAYEAPEVLTSLRAAAARCSLKNEALSSSPLQALPTEAPKNRQISPKIYKNLKHS